MMDIFSARSETHQEKAYRLDWNIKDALEALGCAVDLNDEAGIAKYSHQLQALVHLRIQALK